MRGFRLCHLFCITEMAIRDEIDHRRKSRFYEVFQASHCLESLFFCLTVTTSEPPTSVGQGFFSCNQTEPFTFLSKIFNIQIVCLISRYVKLLYQIASLNGIIVSFAMTITVCNHCSLFPPMIIRMGSGQLSFLFCESEIICLISELLGVGSELG